MSDFSAFFKPIEEPDVEDTTRAVEPEVVEKLQTDFSAFFTKEPATKKDQDLDFSTFFKDDVKSGRQEVKNFEDFFEKNKERAVRFAKDRLGFTEISPEDAIEEVVEHFRSFKVNEFTSGMDYNYTSAAAADAEKNPRAKQRFEDYRDLYLSFESLPSAFDEGGAPNAFTDYLEGIATAPSTYVSILPGIFTAGAGTAAVKAGAGATAQVAKEGVKRIIMESLKKPLTTIAANPIPTTIATEATLGALQNIGEQKTEQEIDVREDFSGTELTAVAAISGLAPAALAVGLPKKAFSELVSKKSKNLLSEAEEAVAKRNEEATEKAREVLKKNSKVAKAVKEARKPLDEEAVARGEAELLQATKESDLADNLVAKLDPSRMERLDALAVELLVETGTKRKPKERTSDFVSRIVSEALEKEDDKTKDLLRGLYDKYNLSSDDILRMVVNDMYVAESSAMGKGLGQRGQTEKLIRRLTDVTAADIFGFDEDAVKTLKKAGESIKRGNMREAMTTVEETKEGISFRRLDDLRRSLMTSQPATTFRNTVSGYTRIGFDTITRSFDQAIATTIAGITFGKGAKGKVGLLTTTPNADVFASMYGIINPVETRAIRTLMEQNFPKVVQKVFKQIADLSDASGEISGAATDKMIKFMRGVNALNTASDNYFKNVAIITGMKRRLNQAAIRAKQLDPSIDIENFNLEKLIREGKFNDLFSKELKVGDTVIFDGQKELEEIAKEALYFTFQRDPSSELGKAFVNLMHSAPFLTTSLVPFPRFIANALRFTYEYSPLYLINPRVVKTIAGDSDNYEDIAKGLVGTAALFGAMAFRQSEYAGENWWEGKTPDGKTFDMRPFFPAAPYLFFADWITRIQKGEKTTGDRSFVTEAIQALSGTQFRTGTQIYALDKAYKDIAESENYEAAGKIAANVTSNIIATYSIPLTVGQDLYNTFLAPDAARVVRDTKTADLMGLIVNRSLSRVPGNFAIEEMLSDAWGFDRAEVYESATKEEPIRRIAPITRQTYGILLQERRNFFEKEIARLKLSKKVIESRTAVPEADLLLNALYGEYISNYVVPIMQSDRYKNLSDAEKRIAIVDIVKRYKDDVREAVRYNAKQSAPERFGYNPMERQKFMQQDREVRQIALDLYHSQFGKPDDTKKGYDYELLIEMIRAINDRRKSGKYTGDLFDLKDY
jgi:hypothetical protein